MATAADTRGLRMVPPANFAMVNRGVFRSGFPNSRNFAFLKTLRLRSVVRLCDDSCAEVDAFCAEQKIRVFKVALRGNKEPFLGIDDGRLRAALEYIVDARNHPLLLHCRLGLNRTGCVVACLRKLQHRSLSSIFEECDRFTGRRGHSILDLQFIELFDHKSVKVDPKHAPSWL